jgi:hypothetical protein
VAGLRDTLDADDEIVRENKALKQRADRQSREIEELRKLLGVLQTIDTAVVKPPRWTVAHPSKGGRKAIVTLQLTDTHFDEVVNPAEVGYINAYDRTIAEQRLRRWVERSIILARDYMAGVEYEGCAVLATGDIFSGDIHDELKLSNESPLFASLLHWLDPLTAAIQTLADEFGKLHLAAVVGNHGRNTHRPIYKGRAQNNVEWMLWRILARQFATDERVTFQVSDAIDLTVRLYNTTYLLTHGDEFKGGSGISGAKAPLMLGQHRTIMRQMATTSPVDYLVVGHFHQLQLPSQGIVLGGSLKGYDEYAFGKRFRPEVPQQAFWLTSAEHGPTISAPVLVQDREAEGW